MNDLSTLAGFDLETTGPDPAEARAIEAALLVSEPDRPPPSTVWIDPHLLNPTGDPR